MGVGQGKEINGFAQEVHCKTTLCPLVRSGTLYMDHPKDQPLCLVGWTSRVYGLRRMIFCCCLFPQHINQSLNGKCHPRTAMSCCYLVIGFKILYKNGLLALSKRTGHLLRLSKWNDGRMRP